MDVGREARHSAIGKCHVRWPSLLLILRGCCRAAWVARRGRSHFCTCRYQGPPFDEAIVSPLTGTGEAESTGAIEAAARRKRRDTYPELGRARRCRLIVQSVLRFDRLG